MIKMKKAFTLLELMVVLAIIGILLGLVVTVASNMIQTARSQKSDALCRVVQQGIETYRAQKAEWPGPLGDLVGGKSPQDRRNTLGSGGTWDKDKFELYAQEVRETIRTLVQEAVDHNNPVMDISALYVSRFPGEGGNDFGMDFKEAIVGTKRSPKKMSVGEMYFGYPERSRGYFRRFRIIYSIPSDSVEVLKQ